MPYPASPFACDANFGPLLGGKSADGPSNEIRIENETYMKNVTRWLCSSPKISSFRVNTLKTSKERVAELLKSEFSGKIGFCDDLSEVVTVGISDGGQTILEPAKQEVVVDVHCGASVLRGAHVFAPGVIGMLSGIKRGDKVAIYADLSGRCKKGLQKVYDCKEKLFIGNGIARMVRYELFGENLSPGGIAVEVTATISGCPSFDESFLPRGFALLQNLPSVICVRVLDPQPGEVILDMCASPGNKTTHIAALMQNKGTLIAIDKTKNKVDTLKHRCGEFGAIVTSFQSNSTKLYSDKVTAPEHDPKQSRFPAAYFDRILLDAPCSALGKRPQLSNKTPENVIKSHVPVQRKLFTNAVHLLKPGGVLVYSTCTITVAENEGLVAWALGMFDLELQKAEPYLGGRGLKGCGLNEAEASRVQRFGPDENIDSVGFFIAKFCKKK